MVDNTTLLGLRINSSGMAAHMRASKRYQYNHALPDPIGLADLARADPAGLLEVIVRRARDERLPRSRVTLRWPKGFDRSSYRLFSSLDTIDQLAYRVVVSPVANGAASRLAPTVVAHRIEVVDGTWQSAGVRDGWRARQTALLDRFEVRPDLWLTTLDVKNYYPTLGDDVLRRSMNSMGLDAWQLEPALAFRASFDELPGGVGGVPVGPEASAVLGTIGLCSVDRLLSSVEHFRLVDDIWFVSATEAEATSLAGVFAGHLELLDLSENLDKRRIVTGDDALELITDSEIDYIANAGRYVMPAEAMSLFASGIAERKLSRLRFGLNALRRDGSTLAVAAIVGDMTLVDVEPAAIGKYLRSVAPAVSASQRDVLVDHACRTADDHSMAGRIHVTIALAGGDLSNDHRAQLMAAAELMEDRRLEPLRTHLVAAACRGASSTKRFKSAAAMAESHDSLDLRRCVAHVHRESPGRHHSAVIRHLARIEPELRPFVLAA